MKRAVAACALAAALAAGRHAAWAKDITSDTHWSGRVGVEGRLVVEAGATLTIEPGTTVAFMPAGPDEEGLAGCGILVKGALVAVGEPGDRITFTSAATRPAPGDWGEIKLLGSVGSAFTDCDFSCGGWGLHLHDSDLKVERCTFSGNSFGGIRMKGGAVEVAGCVIKGMEVGIRYWKGSPSIHHNTITGNATGIFCRQEGQGAKVRFNNITDNAEYDLKLGDMQKEDLDASYNWWGTADVQAIRKKIFDKAREGYIGSVKVEPPLEEKAGTE